MSSSEENSEQETEIQDSEQDMQSYWKANISLLFKLLVVWFTVSFGAGIVFVEELNSINFFGFKLGFWFAQQGSIYVFVALIFVYSAKMKKLDRDYGVHE